MTENDIHFEIIKIQDNSTFMLIKRKYFSRIAQIWNICWRLNVKKSFIDMEEK